MAYNQHAKQASHKSNLLLRRSLSRPLVVLATILIIQQLNEPSRTTSCSSVVQAATYLINQTSPQRMQLQHQYQLQHQQPPRSQLSESQQAWPIKIADQIISSGQQHERQHSKRQIRSQQFDEALDDSGHAAASDHQGHPYDNHHDEPLALVDGSPSSSGGGEDLQDASQKQQAGTTSGGSKRGKRTLYACEEKQLEIECQLGESIQLIRANYGRFSIQICNEHGQLDWKVNCMSPDSFDIITRSCQAKQSCQLLASNEIFGDACPGTQKYLEVHYQCVPAIIQSASGNRTQSDQQQQQELQSKGNNQIRLPIIKTNLGINNNINNNNNNVIQHQQQHDTTTVTSSASSTASSSLGTNSEIQRQQQQLLIKRPHWPAVGTNSAATSQSGGAAQLPNWMIDVPLELPTVATTTGHLQQQQLVTPLSVSPTSPIGTPPVCGEIAWRQMRWPATGAGQLAVAACPAHTTFVGLPPPPQQQPSGGGATLACLANGQWANRIQAAHCQSNWLRQLKQRHEAGDSPLSVLNELVQRTLAPPHVSSGQGAGSFLNWPNAFLATDSTASSQQQRPQLMALFGADLVQIGRIVDQLVDEMSALLNGISDDKQRISFAREMIQLLVELTNNLASEHQLDAWYDLSSANGDRQRVAGQLVMALESACVSLAYTLKQQQHVAAQENFNKVTESVYVAIQSYSLDLHDQQQQQQFSRPLNQSNKLQVTFPSQASVLGTKWMNMEQRFTLNLQASLQQSTSTPSPASSSSPSSSSSVSSADTDSSGGNQQQQPHQLKVVFVMLRNLGALMEPSQRNGDTVGVGSAPFEATISQQQQQQDKRVTIVNSDLVSFSIVPDSRRSLKVDLSAPIELAFRHNHMPTPNQQQQQQEVWPSINNLNNGPRSAPSRICAYWDYNSSDWRSDGCKLVATNRTHSICACNHLTTFALLTEFDSATVATLMQAPAGHQQQQFPMTNRIHADDQLTNRLAPDGRVYLDGVERELLVNSGAAASGQQQQQQQQTVKAIYLARLLDGQLFAGASEQTTRTLLYVSCTVSGLMLALLLGAAAYNRAHARRLLGSMPSEPPPSLLVAHNSSYPYTAMAAALQRQHQQVQLQTTSGLDLSQHNNDNNTGRLPAALQTGLEPASLASSSSPPSTQPTNSYSSEINSSLGAGKLAHELAGPAPLSASGLYNSLIDDYGGVQRHQQHYGLTGPTPLSHQQQQLHAKIYGNGTGSGNSGKQASSKSSGSSGGGGGTERHLLAPLMIPLHLIVKLFSLELLLVLLLESQTLLQNNSQLARRQYVTPGQSFTVPTAPINTGDEQLVTASSAILNPISIITWICALLLYYLGSSLLCWLLAQLIQLNGHLLARIASSRCTAPLELDSQGRRRLMHQHAPYSKPISMIGAAGSTTIYQQHHSQAGSGAAANRYGACQQQMSSSPTLSTFSSSLANDLAPTASNALTSSRQQSRLEALESSSSSSAVNQRPAAAAATTLTTGTNNLFANKSVGNQQPLDSLYNVRSYNNNKSSYSSYNRTGSAAIKAGNTSGQTMSSSSCNHLIVKLSTSQPLSWCLIHLGPLCLSGLLVWLSYEPSQLINHYAYTSSYTSQLAYWPLLIDSAWTFPMVIHLYCLPSICLALGVLALVLLGRHIRHLSQQQRRQQLASGQFGQFGPSELEEAREANGVVAAAGGKKLASASNWASGLELTRGSAGPNESGDYMELAIESKRTRFVCLTLLALVALNSICWISFFIHCHQALSSAANLFAPTGNSGLIVTFATTNWLIALAICFMQRRTFRRTLKIAGWSRLLRLGSMSKSHHQHCAGLKSTPSPSSTGSHSSDDPNSYYTNNNETGPKQSGQQQHHRQQHHYGTGESVHQQLGPGKLGASPSQHSVFVISSSRPHQMAYSSQQHQQLYGQQAFNSQQQQQQQQLQQQHLYQQLALSQQNIYDSTTNLNQQQQQQQQQRSQQLNALHLIQQQQQQQRQQHQQQHTPMVNYALNRSQFGGSQFHLNQHQQQQQQPGVNADMTLRPLAQHQQHQQQQMFTRNQPAHQHDLLTMYPISATNNDSSGPNGHHHNHNLNHHHHHQQQQQQQQHHDKTLSSSSAGRQNQHQSQQQSGEADGPLVALATANNSNRKETLEAAAAGQHAASIATFGPIYRQQASASIQAASAAPDTLQQQARALTTTPATTEHRLSNGDSAVAAPMMMMNHQKQQQQQQQQMQLDAQNQYHSAGEFGRQSPHSSSNSSSNGGSGGTCNGKQTGPAPSYTDALKAALIQESASTATTGQQIHFRRTNSSVRQQQQQQHRSFASPTAMMIDAPQLIERQQQHQQQQRRRRQDGGHGGAEQQALCDNIYDVANCGLP